MVKRNKRQPGVPGYLKHKGSAQAFTIIRDEADTRRQVSLGTYGTPASKRRYREVVAAFLRSEQLPERSADPFAEQDELTVEEVIAKFLQHAETYYRKPSGEQTNEFSNCVQAVAPLLDLYADELAVDFGPRKLKKVREEMINRGWCRLHINKQADRIKRIFKWAASEELVPGRIYENLRTVVGLRAGRSAARDRPPVQPIAEADIEAALPHLPRVVAVMVQVQYLAGMRPHEVCEMRAADIDRSSKIWLYRPRSHKTEHHGHDRTIALGPRAQELLRPLLRVDGGCLFQPCDAMAERRAAKRAVRRTPLYPSHVRAQKRRRKNNPKWKPGDRYDTTAYRRAITYACKKAKIAKWNPNQLRHARATMIRKTHGLEAAQVALGHARADVTQVYAERDRALALRIAGEIG